MLYLKELNLEDIKKEYEFIKNTPKNENGFTNPYFGVTFEEFKNIKLPQIINYSKGIDLPEGFVPETQYFLWDDEKIVGWFRLRHYLNDFLREGAGHIGYGIGKDYRGKGYANEGLKLTIEKAWVIFVNRHINFIFFNNFPGFFNSQLQAFTCITFATIFITNSVTDMTCPFF